MLKRVFLLSCLFLYKTSCVEAYGDQHYIDNFMFELNLANCLIRNSDYGKIRRDLRRKKLFLIGAENVDKKKFEIGRRDILDALSDLTFLEELHLENLDLALLPDKLLALEELEILSLRQNLLHFLPPGIASLTKLYRINLKGNPLIPDGGKSRWGVKEIEEWLESSTPALQQSEGLKKPLNFDWPNYDLVRRALEMALTHADNLAEKERQRRNLPPRRVKLLKKEYAKQSKDPAYLRKILKGLSPFKSEEELDYLIQLYISYRFDYNPPVVHKVTPQRLEAMMPYIMNADGSFDK